MSTSRSAAAGSTESGEYANTPDAFYGRQGRGGGWMAVRVAERGDKTEPARIPVGNGGLFGHGIFRGAQTRPNSTESTDLYGRVAAAATCCRLGFQAVEGIGRCPDIMPVTGVPLAAGR